MLFLIDYENVRADGMRGCDLLSEKDRLILFYSHAASRMESRYLEQIEQSGCNFEIVKLLKSGKTAWIFTLPRILEKYMEKDFTEKQLLSARIPAFLLSRITGQNVQKEIISCISLQALKWDLSLQPEN